MVVQGLSSLSPTCYGLEMAVLLRFALAVAVGDRWLSCCKLALAFL